MRVFTKAVLAAAVAPLASAFVDTSPLILFSTVDLPHNIGLQTRQSIATAESFLGAVKKTISECSSDAYILISQPGLHSSDFADRRSAPRIRKFVEAGQGRVVSVENGVGAVNLDEVESYVKSTCQARVVTVDASTSSFNSFDEDSTPQLIKLDFPSLPSSNSLRQKGLSQNDAFLSAMISMLPSDKYTIVYASTSVGDPKALVQEKPRPHASFLDAQQPLGKRDVHLMDRQNGFQTMQNGTSSTKGGLFSKYQFFTPILITCIFLGLFLTWVVYLAASGLSGIQVSYGSFEKEMGPGEQKKQR